MGYRWKYKIRIKMTEKWHDIPGHAQEYQASNSGRIRSLGMFSNGRSGSKRWLPGRILKLQQGCHYNTVSLRGKTYNVHHLVSLTFLGPKRGRCVRHGPKGKRDNSVSNLSYGTWTENHLDKYRDKTMNSRPVMRSDGIKFKSLHEASRYSKVSVGHICNVCKGYRKTAGGFTWTYI